MKIRISLISTAILLFAIGGYVIPRWKYWYPAQASSWEPARAEQATPESTVNLMFQITDQGGEADDPKAVMDDRLDTMHMIQGKEKMTPEEQRYAGLFLDNERSAAIYEALRGSLATSAHITANNMTGDSAVISATMKIYPDHTEDWVPTTCTVELKKRGPNWYVDDLKSPRVPDGVYQKFRQKMGDAK
ncbi:MAG TPA: hypothetical protein VJW94_18940 [Candidatus Acidoferrum sp.]|nr:hypothetical protein [Candidatus Acidoferrum sp.]